MKKIKYLAIIQARLGSTRLPNKVLKNVNNKSFIEILVKRLQKSKKIDKIIFAIPNNKNNNKLHKEIEKHKVFVYRGDENNVLKRYFLASQKFNPLNIVRITADCPLIDPQIVDKIIDLFEKNKVDYASNINPPLYPDGLDAEVFSFDSFKRVFKSAKEKFDKEHVTSFYLKNDCFKKINLKYKKDYSNIRITLDQEEDYQVIKKIINHFWPNIHFNWKKIVDLKKQKPKIFLNNHIKRNQGKDIGLGQKLYIRAKKIIPGGNMLLSKRPEMFLPNYWPSYFHKSKGCEVWDLDNKKYFDLSIMGVGTNVLGYGHKEIDDAVKQTIKKGNMSSLNCPEEVILAEKLLEIHPIFDMVRFTRTGGEANAVAIRIARAATGKDNVAVCGYHGWHDWYLSVNLGNKYSLDGHLLPGLQPKGVPKNLKNTSFTFNYNDIDKVKQLIKEKKLAAIKMEVTRNIPPKKNFLRIIRKLCTENNVALIFDECTTGFRTAYGGIYKKYNVSPDIVLFGKALGNGYAINSIIGKKEFMEEAQRSFISSTFWTERIGPTAALKTIEVMKKIESWKIINKISKKIKKNLEDIAKKNQLKIMVDITPATINFKLNYKDWLKYKTFITQEMLKKGFLSGSSIFVCINHNDKILKKYFFELNKIFAIIFKCLNDKNLIDQLLIGPISHNTFKRLN